MTNQSTTMEPGISLDARLIAMLEQRKLRSTYRSLKEYKTVQSASLRKGRKQGELVDFVSERRQNSCLIFCSAQALSSHPTITSPLHIPPNCAALT
jgi:hypothetical protein